MVSVPKVIGITTEPPPRQLIAVTLAVGLAIVLYALAV